MLAMAWRQIAGWLSISLVVSDTGQLLKLRWVSRCWCCRAVVLECGA
jgi:hypothetical protein